MAGHARVAATTVVAVIAAACALALGPTAAGSPLSAATSSDGALVTADGTLAVAHGPDGARWTDDAHAGPAARHAGQRSRHTVSTAKNWSGVVQDGADMTAVGATWTVPAVQPSRTLEATSTWIGLGGATGSADPGLIQTGTTEATLRGETGYSAWYETLPTLALPLTTPTTPGGTPAFTVTRGDTMQAGIRSVGTGRWDVFIRDVTRGWTFTRDVTYALSPTSAEWITERPSLTTGRLLPLAQYGATTFEDLSVASDGAAPGPASSTPAAYTFVLMLDTATDVISAPGPLQASTSTSFTDHYVRVPARIYGENADGTAAQELERQFASGAGICPGTPGTRPVVLATDATYPDALASAYLASTLGTGTLLTGPGSLSATAAAAVRNEGITHVFVVGGGLVVGTAVVRSLESLPAYACGGAAPLGHDVSVTRIAGPTLFDTAAQIALWPSDHHLPGAGRVDLAGAYAGATGHDGLYNATAGTASGAPAAQTAVPTAVLATGNGFQDAEAASTLAYAEHLPVLLTTPQRLSTQAATALGRLGVEQVIVMGGPLAVSDGVVASLEARGVSVLRVAGADDTQTASELAKLELETGSGGVGLDWPDSGGVVIARGDFYSDGLAGAVVAADGPGAADPEPLLLTAGPDDVGASLATFLGVAGTTGIDGKVVTHMTILGGPLAVTRTAANTMAVDLTV